MRPAAAASVAAAIGLATSAGAMAEGMAKAEYAAARKNIVSDFRTATVGCDPMLAGIREICLADVAGREKVALVELEAAYQPSEKAREGVRIARAQAGLSLALARCAGKPAAAKGACAKEAEAAHAAALAAPVAGVTERPRSMSD